LDVTSLLELVLGEEGALVVLSVAVFVLWRKLAAKEKELDEEKDERLKDARDSQKLAEAYLKLREQEKGPGS
jgi:ABC-type nickel/cobalt efflux system permease component RcnA